MRSFLTFSLLSLVSLGVCVADEPQISLVAQNKPVLTLYYMPSCPHSQRVLTYLRSIHKRVPLKNVDTDPAAKNDLRSFGKMQVPVLLIDKTPLYNDEEIINWLSQHQDALEQAP